MQSRNHASSGGLSDADRKLRDKLLRDSGFDDLEDSENPDGLLRTHAFRAVSRAGDGEDTQPGQRVSIEAAELQLESTAAYFDIARTLSRRKRVQASPTGHAAWRLMCDRGLSVREAARDLGISRQKVERETEPFRRKMESVRRVRGLDPTRHDIEQLAADAWLAKNQRQAPT